MNFDEFWSFPLVEVKNRWLLIFGSQLIWSTEASPHWHLEQKSKGQILGKKNLCGRRRRWFKVTFWYPSWRSLSHWKDHLTIPKRSQRIARLLTFTNICWSWLQLAVAFWHFAGWFVEVMLMLIAWAPIETWYKNCHTHTHNAFSWLLNCERVFIWFWKSTSRVLTSCFRTSDW